MMIKFRHIIHLFIAIFTDFYGLLRSLFGQVQHNQWFRNEFPFKAQANKLFVLGNGKSLSDVVDHIEMFEDTDFGVVNNSINTELFWEIKPKLYTFTDRDYHTLQREDIVAVRENILKIDWPISICIPYHYPKWFGEHCKQNPYVTVYKYNSQPWYPELRFNQKLRMHLFKHNILAPHCTNVMVAAIFSSMLIGYKRIFILGAEHSWMHDIRVNDKNEVVLCDRHYYGEKERVWVDYDGMPIKITDLTESLTSTFRSYYDLEEFSQFLGDTKICNCTEGSYIDAFERLRLDHSLN